MKFIENSDIQKINTVTYNLSIYVDFVPHLRLSIDTASFQNMLSLQFLGFGSQKWPTTQKCKNYDFFQKLKWLQN